MLTDDELKDIQWAAMSKVGNASKNLSAAISAGLRAVADAAVKDAMKDLGALGFESTVRVEGKQPFGFLICDSRMQSEDFTRERPEQCGQHETIVALYLGAPAAVKDAAGGEPVAWARNLTDPRPDTVTDLMYCSVAEHERGDTSRYIPLYTRPQASAAVPEKKTGPIARTLEGYGYVNGWNACIDAMIGNRPEVKNAE